MTLLISLVLSAINPTQLQEISGLLSRGQMTEALAMLEPLAKRHPKDPVVAGLLGRARLHAGDAKGAVAPLKRSLAKLPSDGEGFNNLGVALMQLEQLDQAAQAFARAVVLMPRQPQTWRNLAGAYTNLKRLADAAKAWKRYIAFRPNDAEAHCVYGGVLLELKRPRDAATQLRSGAKTTKDTVCLHDYADTLGRLNEPVQALKILGRLTRLDPKNSHAHYLRAYILIGAKEGGRSGRAKEALAAIERSLMLRPKRAASHHLHGFILSQMKRHEEALKAFGRARDLAPTMSVYTEAEAIARVRVGEGKKAVEELKKIVKKDPSHLEALRALAHVYMQEKQWGKARLVLMKAKNADLAVHQDLAVVLMESGQIAKAIAHLKKLREEHPKQGSIAFNLALALRRSGAMKAALHAAHEARLLSPENDAELLLEARLLLELERPQEALTLLQAKPGPPTYAVLFLSARALRMSARLPAALRAAQGAEKIAVDDVERRAARRLQGKVLTDLGRGAEAIGIFREPGASGAELGIALSRAGRAKEAVRLLRSALARNDDDVELHLAYASALQALGKAKRARRTLIKARKRWPRHGGLTNDTAMAWLAAGKRQRAVALLKKGVEENPGHPSLVRNYARHLTATKRRRQAIDLLRQASSLRPHLGALHTALGEQLMSAKRKEEARAAFRQALDAGTPDPLAQARLGDLARRSGKLDEAIAAYTLALDARPGMLEAHNGMGMALHGLERFDQAIAQYRKGLVHAPNDPELHNNLGSSLYLKGQFPRSLSAFERATQADPSEVAYWRNQLMVLKEQGRLEDAEIRLKAALQQHPGHASLKNEGLSLQRAKAMRERLRVKPGLDGPHRDKAPH
jgi:Flp pilus assembly protein TadD